MLDDLKLLHQRDAQDTLGLSEKQFEQLGFLPIIENSAADLASCTNIVYAGMGSSALAAEFAKALIITKPCEILRGYDIPAYVDRKTLLIAASSSGNTEETVAAVQEAQKCGAQIVVLSGGGALADLARTNKYPLIILPTFAQARFGSVANLKALAIILQLANASQKNPADLEAVADFIRSQAAQWLPIIPTKQNLAKQLALDCIGKSVVVYSGPLLVAAAYKWKIAFNENAKQVAWCGQYPEFSHNEFTGWTNQPVAKPYAVIELQSSLEHPRIQKRIQLSERLLSGMRPQPQPIAVQGKNPLAQLLWASNLADFVTIYTAILNGVNPGPVELVDKFKQQMEE